MQPRPHQDPPVTITRLADELLVIIALPGLAPEAVQVQLSGDRHLLINGTAPLRPIAPTHLAELWEGPFHRTVPLPLPVQGPIAQPSFEQGLMRLRLRLAGEALPTDLGTGRPGLLA